MPSRSDDDPLHVYITIDTEVWPSLPGWREARLAGDIDSWLYGKTPAGEFGVRFQLDLMDAHGVRAVFFTEPLFSHIAGLPALRDLVALIAGRGHDVQLHAHSEWLQWLPGLLPGHRGQHLRHFGVDQQETLLRACRTRLEEAGAAPPSAFRAGNFGANLDTLRALRRIGIAVDSSYNPLAPQAACGIATPSPLFEACDLEGVREVPVSFFEDWPGHTRPAQLCAVSSAEMEHAIEAAWRGGRRTFVIVSHSFELLDARRTAPCGPVVKRMERLCRFLEKNAARFRTATFREPAPLRPAGAPPAGALRGSLLNTIARFGEQLQKRV